MKFWRRALAVSAAAALCLSGCGGDAGSGSKTEQTGEKTEAAETSEETGGGVLKFGAQVTDTQLANLSPFATSGTYIEWYKLVYEQLLYFNEVTGELEPALADSYEWNEDKTQLTMKLNEKAAWQDGEDFTADDVLYTYNVLKEKPVFDKYALWEKLESVTADGETIVFQSKDPFVALPEYISQIYIVPEHIWEKEDAATFTNSEPIGTGPFIWDTYTTGTSVSFHAYEDYWKGAPKIDKLNIRIVEGSQLYAGLSAGEIDITHQTMSAFRVEDYESVEALEGVRAVYGDPVTNQSVFIRTQNVTDPKVRQALLCAIDRNQILEQLLKGHGEVVDGFLSSASPYFVDTITPVSYDPEKAKTLLSEAGWDSSQTLKFYVNSGDSSFINAATIMVAQWQAVGIKAEIQTVDFATLMDVATKGEFDILAVQYTYAPVDPYADVAWLLGGPESWTGYTSPEVEEALSQVALTNDVEGTKELYSIVDRKVQEDVPMFSAYVISSLAAVNERLTGAEPTVYGFFNHVEQWDVQ